MTSSHVEEVKHIATLVRALVTSRKAPAILNEILRDYRNVEGEQLPFRKLGYNSAKDLLADSGEFFFDIYDGEVCVSVKANEKSAHITDMVRQQNRGKSRRIVRPNQRAPMRSYNYNLNISSGGDMHEHKPPSDRNNNSSHYIHNAAAQQQPAKKVQPQQLPQRIAPPDDAVNRRSNGPAPKELSEMLGAKLTPRAILGQQQLRANTSNINKNDNNNNTQRKEFSSPESVLMMKENTSKQYQEINWNSQLQNQQGLYHALSQPLLHQYTVHQTPLNNYVPIPKSSSSVQDRLKVKVNAVGAGDTTNSKSETARGKQINDPQSFSPTNGQQHEPDKNLESLDCNGVAQLENYCAQRGYPAPEYSLYRAKKGFCYRVLVHNRIFTTYPMTYGSEISARNYSALLAIEELRNEGTRQVFPLCTYTDAEIIEVFYKMLANRPCGLFTNKLPDLFESEVSLSLPKHWWSLLTQSNRFRVEKLIEDDRRFVVFANREANSTGANGRASDEVGHASRSANQGPPAEETQIVVAKKPKPITLPWDKKYWDLVITYCDATTEVWARLIGSDYNGPYEQLMGDIEEHMKCDKSPAPAVVSKQIYLVYIVDCSWHRARVDELDERGEKALCFYIDFGDSEWLPVSELRFCPEEFLQLPAQAILFSLFGLRDFAGYSQARRHLDALLLNKSVIGEILTKEGDFTANKLNERSQIEVVLYDTSTSEDINLNSQLMQEICEDMAEPELKSVGITNVVVTHITDKGELYLRIPNDVLKLMQDLVNSKLSEDQHRADINDLKLGNLFLIGDKTHTNEQTSWHRGVLLTAPTSSNITESDIFFIDSGRTERVQHSKLFRLESVSMVLSKLPAQAIRVCLHNIPPVNEIIVGRLRGLLSRNCEAMVKVAKLGYVPMVTVYKRMETVETVCTINDIIRIEHELAYGDNGDDVAPCLSAKSPISSNDITKLPRLRCYESIPEIDKYFEVRVTMSANPSNFMIQPYKDYPQLRKLMKDLQAHCEMHNETTIPADKIVIGQAYAAKNPDGFFHRVIVLNMIVTDVFHVSYCDFGDIAALDSKKFRTLPQEFRQLPIMALKAKLHGIEPRGEHWTLDDCLRFRTLTVGMKFVSIVKAISYDGPPEPENQVLELELIDVSTPEDIRIHEVLLKEDRAVIAIE